MARPLLIAHRENATIEDLKQLFNRPDVDIWFADESGFEGIRVAENAGTKRAEKPG